MNGNGDSPKTFALIGAAGYIAPRHMRAVKELGGDLVAAVDPSDSVGQMDSYFPEARFFVEFERFDRHVDKLRRRGELIDFVSICSPNYLHDAHARFALRSGADAICEKPLVLNPWNIDALQEIEQSTGQKVNTILQLRLHPSIIALKEEMPTRSKSSSGVSGVSSSISRYSTSTSGGVNAATVSSPRLGKEAITFPRFTNCGKVTPNSASSFVRTLTPLIAINPIRIDNPHESCLLDYAAGSVWVARRRA